MGEVVRVGAVRVGAVRVGAIRNVSGKQNTQTTNTSPRKGSGKKKNREILDGPGQGEREGGRSRRGGCREGVQIKDVRGWGVWSWGGPGGPVQGFQAKKRGLNNKIGLKSIWLGPKSIWPR